MKRVVKHEKKNCPETVQSSSIQLAQLNPHFNSIEKRQFNSIQFNSIQFNPSSNTPCLCNNAVNSSPCVRFRWSGQQRRIGWNHNHVAQHNSQDKRIQQRPSCCAVSRPLVSGHNLCCTSELSSLLSMRSLTQQPLGTILEFAKNAAALAFEVNPGHPAFDVVTCRP